MKDRGFFQLAQTTTFFGQITHDALAKFQASVGLEAVGQIGPKTLALLNGSATSIAASIILERPLFLGTSGADVSALQQFLKDHGFYTYPEITGYFGPITKAAVKAFQIANGLEPVGFVGPQTRAALHQTVVTDVPSTTTTSTSTTSTALGTVKTAPSTPTSISVTTNYSQVSLSWGTVASAMFYNVKRRDTGSYRTIASTTSTVYTDTTVSRGTNYYYIITALNSAGESASSTEVSTWIPSPGGGSPSDTTPPVISAIASSTTSTTATINWSTNENADSQIEYGLTSSYTSTTTLDSTLTTGHSVVLNNLIGNTIYHYRIRTTDGQSNLATSSDQTFTTADFSDFDGTGRVAVMALGVNQASFATFGDGAGIRTSGTGSSFDRIGRRVGNPWYVLLKELSTNVWLGYDLPATTASDGPVNLSSYAVYKPMKKVRFDDASATDGNGGSADYPQTSSTQYVQWNLASVATNVTRLGVVIGFMSDTSSVATVTITDNSSGNPVVPNLLPTAQQAVDRAQIASSALTTNGGTLSPSAYVLGTSFVDAARAGAKGYAPITIADSLPAGSYTVRVSYAGVKGGQVNSATAVDRMYISYLTYGASSYTESTSGTELYPMDYWADGRDGSANESFTWSGKVTSAGGTNTILGGGHGNEHQTALDLSVDGSPIILYSKTATRARTAGGVATITTTSPHGLSTGDVVTISGIGVTGYNGEGDTVTVIDSTTFSYPVTGYNSATINSAETTTTDTGGRVISQKIVTGSTASIHRDSYLTHPNYSGGTGSIAVASTTYALNRSALQVSYTLTASQQFTHDTQTYNALMSIWNGDRTAYGPESMGAVRWRPLYSGTETYLNANDNSVHFAGQNTGYTAFGEALGKASLVQLIASSVLSDWNGGLADSFVQDRTGTANRVDKLYFPLWTTTGNITPAGYTMSATIRRYDAIFPTNTTNALFQSL